MRRFVALAFVLAACGAPQKRTEALEQRMAAVEEQLVQLRAELAERERVRTEHTSVASLEGKIAELERRVPPRPSRPPMPGPEDVYSVPVGNSPVIGLRTAKITLVVAGEYACPFCEKSRATIAELRARYGNDLRIVHKSFIVHTQTATEPARAACAAHKQGRFEAMDQALWEKAFKAHRFDADHLRGIAKDLKLDMKRFEADFTGAACAAEVEGDQQLLARLGLRATPGFWINGRFLLGAQPTVTFARIIDEEMEKANAAIKRGVKVQDYYDTVVKAGLTELEPAP